MATVTPPIRWGSREVNLAWVPESADEMVATARPLLGEMAGALAFTFIAGAAIIVNSISDGGLGLLGIAVATALAYGIIVSAFYSVSGGHLTGGAMNLARVFGTDFVAGEWADFGSYAIGLIGGFVAGLVYQYFFISREES